MSAKQERPQPTQESVNELQFLAQNQLGNRGSGLFTGQDGCELKKRKRNPVSHSVILQHCSQFQLLSQVSVLLSPTMAKDMTLLWGAGSSPCWRVMITLEEKNLQGYNQKRFYFEKMEHKSAEVMAMNPRGQLPAFKHGDKILNESYAAILYLEDQFKSQGNKLIPDSPAEKALMYQRMMEGNTFQQKLVEALYYNYLVPEGERHDSALKRHQEALTAELKLWDGYLKKVGDGYMAGKSFSLADAAIFPIFAYVFYYCPQCEARYPNMAAYYNRLKDRPSIKATWPPARFENPEGMEYIKDC